MKEEAHITFDHVTELTEIGIFEDDEGDVMLVLHDSDNEVRGYVLSPVLESLMAIRDAINDMLREIN